MALVVGVAGTAVAGQVASISVLTGSEKKTVKKIAKKIANKQITARAGGLSVKSADSATTAVTANTANSAGSLSTLFWAVVNADGSLARGSTGVTSEPVGGNAYRVITPRDVSGCSYQVSFEGNDTGNSETGELSANPSGNQNAIYVTTFNSGGTGAPKAFMALITCQP